MREAGKVFMLLAGDRSLLTVVWNVNRLETPSMVLKRELTYTVVPFNKHTS